MKSNHIFDKLKAAKKDKKLILFCGSGLSRNFKRPNGGKPYPDWVTMVLEILEHDYVKKNIPEKARKELITNLTHENVLPTLNKIIIDNKININIIKNSILTSIFPNIEHGSDYLDTLNKYHMKLLSICENKVITTNYDNAFEVANPDLLSCLYVYDGDNVINAPSKGEFLFKLHGDIKRPDSCVLTEEDYENLYQKEGTKLRISVENSLKPLLSTNSIIFIGFSMSDIEIKRIFTYLNTLGSSDLNSRVYFISTSRPVFGTMNFDANWIKVEGDDISKAYENKIQEIYDYVHHESKSKSKENLIQIQKRIDLLVRKEIPSEVLFEDLERIIVESPTIFQVENTEVEEIFSKIIRFTIENKFTQNSDDAFVLKIFQKLNNFSISKSNKENQLIIEVIQSILDNGEMGKQNYSNYISKINILDKITNNLKQVKTEYSTKILESNILQSGIFSHIKSLKTLLIGEFEEKQKPLQDFFNDYKKDRQVQKFSKIKPNFINNRILVKDSKFDIISSNNSVDDYIFCKSGLVSSMKFKPNNRLSLVLNSENVAEGYIDKQLAFISIDEDDRKNIITESFLIDRFHNKKEFVINFTFGEAVGYFSEEDMILYRNDMNLELPSIFIRNKAGDFLSYKDVLSAMEFSDCRNDSFCNNNICNVMPHISSNLIPIDLEKVTFQYIEQHAKEKLGFLVKLGQKKIGFFHMASYSQWIRHFEGDLTPLMKIQSFHKDFYEKIQVLDGKKSTFIIEPSAKYIFESFSETDTIFDLIKYFARPETIDIAIIENQNSTYSIISFRDLFLVLNNYFSTLK